MNARSILPLALLAILAAAPLHAAPAVPALINYQGYVTNASGVALPDGNYDITFRLYTASTGGTAIWAEKQTVTVNGGQFSVLLGNGSLVSGINHDPLSTFITTTTAANGSIFIGLTVNAVGANTAAEFTPRQQLLANPFAHRAILADSAASVVANGVVSAAIADSAVSSGKLAANAVNSAKIADGTVINDDLANNTVSGAKILDGTIATADLADNSVTSAKIGTAAVSSGKLATGAVNSAAILDSTIVSADLADGAVTAAKLAASSINDTQLADGSVTNAKLAAGAVTSASLANGAVTSGKLGPTAVGPSNTTFAGQAGSALTLFPAGANSSTEPILIVSNANIRASAPTESIAYPFRVRQFLSAGTGFAGGSYEGGFQMVKGTNTFQQNVPLFKLQLLSPTGAELGGAFLSTGGTWTATSDARWKKDIHAADGLLGKAMQLRPSWFRFKAQDDKAPETLGFIAQEVEKVLPNFVTQTNDRLTLDYAGLSTVAIGAVQEQQTIIEKQSEQIKDLAAKNAALEERLTRLEKAMSSVAAK